MSLNGCELKKLGVEKPPLIKLWSSNFYVCKQIDTL
jgi:hypothetical protein